MIRSTDRATPTLTKPGEIGTGMPHAVPSAVRPTLSNKPLTTQPNPFGTLKAIGMILLIGVVGVGAVLLIRGVRNLGREQALRPMAEVTGSEQPPLRDRVRVIKPKTTPPSSQDGDDKSAPEEPSMRRRQTQSDTVRSSYGFGDGAPIAPSEEDDATASADPEELEDDAAAEVPDEEPDQDAQVGSDPAASEQPDDQLASDSADSASDSASTQATATVRQTIASLLQPPPPIPVTVATKPRPVPSPPVAITPRIPRPIPSVRVPSITLPTSPYPSPGTTGTPTNPTSPTPPPVTATPTPSQSDNQQPTPSPTPQTASIINPSTASNGVYVGQLQITGSTQFPIRTLAEAVQRAIAANPTNPATPTTPTNPATPTNPSPTPPTNPTTSSNPTTFSNPATSANPATPTNPTTSSNPATPTNPATNSDSANNTDPLTINRTLTASELLQASEAITKLYIDNGYINSGAYVPAEVLNGATPEIRVIEGKLELIKVEVTPADSLWLGQPLSSGYVEWRLGAAIRSPLKLDQLLDAVKLLEQDPLISSISTELAPGTTIGGSILNVKVRQAPPVHGNLSISNNRSPSVGQLEQQVGVSQANLLGLGDSLQASFRRTEGSSDWSVNYSVPITPQNGTLRLSYTNGNGQVIEEPFRVLDITSKSQNYEVAFRQPLIQTSTEEFALTLRATHYYNKGIFLAAFNDGTPLPFPAVGADANGETRVTALRFGQEWIRRSEQDVISLQSEFSYGLNALGATTLPFPPDSRFISWQGQGLWVHSFAPDTLLALRGKVQLSDRELVPSEQISLGGVDTIRGYRPSTFLADNGWFTSLEGYVPVLRIPEWNGLLQVVPFFDMGQGWNNSNEQPSPNSLMSVGLGLQWKMGDNFRARLDWGVPLINAAPNGRSLEQNLFFSIIFSP